MTAHLHHAPSACPVCGERLVTSRLGCQGCGTELVGSFAPCAFCALDADDHDLLRVFLTSRGNLKDLEKHLGVSYPTARARFNAVLQRLGWSETDVGEPDEGAASGGAASEGAASEQSDESGPARASEAQPRGSAPTSPDAVRDQVLAQVASGALSPDAAADLLGRLR